MKQKGNKGVFVILIIGGLLLIASVIFTKLGLVENGTTYAASISEVEPIHSVDDLKNNKLYVWDDCKKKTIDNKNNRFFECPTGNVNIKYEDREAAIEKYTVWIPSDKDNEIPTLTSNDKLLYVCNAIVPDTFTFLRMYENGYSIGITSLIPDASEHYYISYMLTDADDYKKSINVKSDANDLAGLNIERLYLDKIGGKEVTEQNISDGGIVTGLTKDEQYICEFYTGTFFQDYLLTANQHTFTEFEEFTCYGYEFMHSNCIEISIPDWLCSGYYCINGIGLFRYVDDSDIGTYNGEPYDEHVAWNEPLIQYDEYGKVIYDPSQQVEEELQDSTYGDSTQKAASVKNNLSSWSYSISKVNKPFTATIKLASVENGKAAQLLVKEPNGNIDSFTEEDNVIYVSIDSPEKGAYEFELSCILGRSYTVEYSTGETYSGVATESEPEGDEDVEEIQ